MGKSIPQATITSKGPPMLAMSFPHMCSFRVHGVPGHCSAIEH